jgi:hypothetical protein
MASDPHQGGRLEDMAAKGTSIPGDAGKMNVVSFYTCFADYISV